MDGKVIFGEITFTNSAGFGRVKPKEFSMKMGNYLVLPENRGGVIHNCINGIHIFNDLQSCSEAA